MAAAGYLNIWFLVLGFFIATVAGDNQNLAIGKMIGWIPEQYSIFKKIAPTKLLNQAKHFLEKYGYIAITFSRFIPLMRTTMPFTSGVTGYPYHFFVTFNLIGAILWTVLWSSTGFLLGNIRWVDDHLMITLLAISASAIVPTIFALIKKFSNEYHKE